LFSVSTPADPPALIVYYPIAPVRELRGDESHPSSSLLAPSPLAPSFLGQLLEAIIL
jgi:hypothetical protein